MRHCNTTAAVTLLVAGAASEACASHAAQNPQPVAQTATRDQPTLQRKADVATAGQDGQQAKERSPAAEATESARSVEDLRRCPDPYGGEGSGWLAQPEPDERKVRELNARHGLLCSQQAERVGCVDNQGRVAVPVVYIKLTYFAEPGVALALLPDKGWVYIDTKNRTIGKAETLDATPDEVFGGYARFRAANGKIGYLDRNRRVAIPAQFDGAFPFKNCRALVCVGCRPERWDANAPEGAACTGKAFVIDESGAKVEQASGADWERCGQKNPAASQQP
jgi:hypothetical protein